MGYSNLPILCTWPQNSRCGRKEVHTVLCWSLLCAPRPKPASSPTPLDTSLEIGGAGGVCTVVREQEQPAPFKVSLAGLRIKLMWEENPISCCTFGESTQSWTFQSRSGKMRSMCHLKVRRRSWDVGLQKEGMQFTGQEEEWMFFNEMLAPPSWWVTQIKSISG